MQNNCVLLVDDDKQTLHLLERLFKQIHYKTISARSVYQAFGMVTNALCLVVTDWDMPHMNGSDLLLMVRDILPLVPIIGMSGHTPAETAHVSPRFDGFIHKPFRIAAFYALVRSVLKTPAY
jgi:DNA-binding NtrC family response regulator